MPALKPYWGKPTVRNFRGDDGNGGIIRSPQRAIVLPNNHLNHSTWECKYHVVFTPKYRKKLLFGQIRRHLGSVFRELAQRKE